jgi:hypothetical protein
MVNPVTLPRGRAKLATSPGLTGLPLDAKTMAPVATIPMQPRPVDRRPVPLQTVSTPGVENSKASIERLDGERFVVPEEQDEEERSAAPAH